MRLLIVVLSLLLLTGHALAAGIGVIVPSYQAGDLRQEIGGFRQELDWDSDNSSVADGVAIQNAAYLQADFALDRRWSAFFRLGAADLVLEDAAPPDYAAVGRNLEGDVQVWGGAGLKGVLLGAGRVLSLGLFLEGRYFGPYSDEKTILVAGQPVRLELNLDKYWAVQAALPLQVDLKAVTLYAGPLLNVGSAELELTATALGVSDTATAAYTPSSPLTAIAGIALPLGDSRLCFDARVGGGMEFGLLLNFSRLIF